MIEIGNLVVSSAVDVGIKRNFGVTWRMIGKSGISAKGVGGDVEGSRFGKS